MPPEEYEAIVRTMRDYSRKFGDMDHEQSNITRAINLMEQAGADFNTLYLYIIEADRIMHKKARIKNRMSYFFSVLADLLGFKGDHVPRSQTG